MVSALNLMFLERRILEAILYGKDSEHPSVSSSLLDLTSQSVRVSRFGRPRPRRGCMCYRPPSPLR